MDARLRIEMFGGLRARCGDEIVAEFPPQQSSLLLALLALDPGKGHMREELIAQLWPEADAENGQQRLRQLVYSLRRQLEQPPFAKDGILLTTRTQAQLNPANVETDVGEFEAALRAARQATESRVRVDLLTLATQLYRGDLLPGFYADGIIMERNRLAALQQQALTDLTLAREHAGQWDAAIAAARRAVAQDPLHEESHSHLIRLYLAAGQQVAALRQYQELVRVLASELGVAPSESTVKLLEMMLNDSAAVAHRPVEPQAAVDSSFAPIPTAPVPIIAPTTVPIINPKILETPDVAATAGFVPQAHPHAVPLPNSRVRSAQRRVAGKVLMVVSVLLVVLVTILRHGRPAVESTAGAQKGKEQWTARLVK